jgi:hypothetical protein
MSARAHMINKTLMEEYLSMVGKITMPLHFVYYLNLLKKCING